MKRFLIGSGILLAIALLAVVYVWYQISNIHQPAYDTNTAVAGETATEKVTGASVPESGIPLRDLPLGDTQKKVLNTAGIDVETFIITPEMQVCATEKLGAERMAEIVAGSTPGPLEVAKLLPCVSVE